MSGKRTIDPGDDTRLYGAQRLGFKNQRDQLVAMGEGDRISTRRVTPNRIYETLTFFNANLAASANTGGNLILMPSGTTVADNGNFSLYTGTPGRCVSVRLYLSEILTTGTCSPMFRANEGGTVADYQFDDCIVDAAAAAPLNRHNHIRIPWDIAPAFDSGATIQGRFVTSAGLAPLTADATLILVIGYEDPKL